MIRVLRAAAGVLLLCIGAAIAQQTILPGGIVLSGKIYQDGNGHPLTSVPSAPTGDPYTAASPLPVGSSGATLARVAAAAGTNATVAKASPGILRGYALYSNVGTIRYVKLYNSATSPAVGTDVPVATIIVPANGSVSLSEAGAQFSTGISYAITAGVADTDTTPVAANDIHGMLLVQ